MPAKKKKAVAKKKTVKKLVKKPVKKGAKKPVKKITKKAVKKIVKKGVKQGVKKPAKKIVKKIVKKTALKKPKTGKKAVKKSVKKEAPKKTSVKSEKISVVKKAVAEKTPVVKMKVVVPSQQTQKNKQTLTETRALASVKKQPQKLPVKKALMIEQTEAVAEVAAENMSKKATTLLGALEFMPYQPQSDEAYMSDKQREHFRQILMAWKQQLMQDVDMTVGHLKEEAVFYADPVDRASQEEGFNLELRTRDRERKLIKKIEQSLDLLNGGDYGFCEDCGAEIGIRRLEARPTAVKCIDCKTFQEIREKQLGG